MFQMYTPRAAYRRAASRIRPATRWPALGDQTRADGAIPHAPRFARSDGAPATRARSGITVARRCQPGGPFRRGRPRETHSGALSTHRRRRDGVLRRARALRRCIRHRDASPRPDSGTASSSTPADRTQVVKFRHRRLRFP
jgi:hypothetical protein